jgi:ElaB/YqjD/DUF883 family membrane-anchored ribosome-binding protein
MRDEMTLSEVEPELGAIEAYETREEPPFPLVLRGYDRRAVDDYLQMTNAKLAEYEALELPSVAVQEALGRVADDTGGILKEAHETADGVMTRARDEAERLVREAREEADRTIASANARARQIAIDTDALWQERMRLIDDAHAVATQLTELADTAAARFPAEEDSVVVAEPVDEELVEQPTESFDVEAMLAEEDASEEDRPLPDGLDDLEPPPEFR